VSIQVHCTRLFVTSVFSRDTGGLGAGGPILGIAIMHGLTVTLNYVLEMIESDIR
jgi:hypothetical protein